MGGGRCVDGAGGDVDGDGKVVDEFVVSLSSLGIVSVAAQLVDHSRTCTGVDPDVAVDDPYDVALCFSVGSAHVSDLRVGS